MKFDLEKEGLESIFKPYQIRVWKHLVKYHSAISRETYENEIEWAKKQSEKPMSRASIIFFMNDMVEAGLLTYSLRTGKGGHHRVYHTKFNSLDELKSEMTKRVVAHVNKELGSIVR